MVIKIIQVNICLFIMLSLFNGNIWGQDKITRVNGEVIKCRIINEDSVNVYFSKSYNDYTVYKTYLPKNEIASIEYYKQTRDTFKTDFFALGFGLGLNYGGLVGLNFQVKPIEDIAVFVGAGYGLVDLGVTGGIKMNLHSKSNFNPYFMAMYGYNAAVIIKKSSLSEAFYGPSLGIGLDYKLNSSRRGFFSTSIIFPFRFKAREYITKMEDEYNVEFENDFWPVLFSFGYHF